MSALCACRAAAALFARVSRRLAAKAIDADCPRWALLAGTGVTLAGLTMANPSSAISSVRATEEDEGKRTEVVIVGGGIVGAAVAYFLTEAGVRDVTLLERGSIGCEASGLSAGTIWNAGMPTGTVRPQDAALVLRSKSAILLEQLGGCEFNHCGALDVAATPAEARLLRADFEVQTAQGLNVEWLDSQAEIAALEPALAGGSAMCATHTPLSGSVQPALAAQRYAALATASGCHVVEDAECISLTRYVDARGAERVQVKTADGRSYCASHVVIAGGHRSAPLARSLGVHLPVVPVKGIVCVTTAHAEPGALRKVIFDMGSRLYFAENGSGRDDANGVPAKCTHEPSGARRCRKLYGKQCGPSDGHMILFGGDRLPGAAADDYTIPAASAVSIRANVTELCPSLMGFHGKGGGSRQEDEEAHAGEWAGLMPFSRDGWPIVGTLAPLGLPAVWLACGFGPSGIMEGPHAAKLLAARVAADCSGCQPAMLKREGPEDKVAMACLDPSRPGCCGLI